jgi:hypothetical protein
MSIDAVAEMMNVDRRRVSTLLSLPRETVNHVSLCCVTHMVLLKYLNVR